MKILTKLLFLGLKPRLEENIQATGQAVRVLLVGAFLAIGLAPSARADTTYTYTGQPFTYFYDRNTYTDAYNCPSICNLTGYFTLATPIGITGQDTQYVSPKTYNFTDGLNDFNNNNSTIPNAANFKIATNGLGVPINWLISFIEVNGVYRYTTFSYAITGAIGNGDNTTGYLTGCCEIGSGISVGPGSWSVSTTAVPEPQTYAMLLAGLGLLGFTAWRRKDLAA